MQNPEGNLPSAVRSPPDTKACRVAQRLESINRGALKTDSSHRD